MGFITLSKDLRVREFKKKQKEKHGISLQFARGEVLRFYGAVCNCCGESQWSFLEIDHVFNDGAQHRKEIKINICIWLVLNNFKDSERFQILCANCNRGKYKNNGICPHEIYIKKKLFVVK